MANDPTESIREIRGMRFPTLFRALWLSGHWTQPQENLINSTIPWLQGPLEFIESMSWMANENRGVLADIPRAAKTFQEYRGFNSESKPDLPWLDVDQALLIAVNRIPGDDLGVAIDFRSSLDDPRVVASRWCSDPHRIEWCIVTETFTEFADKLNLTN